MMTSSWHQDDDVMLYRFQYVHTKHGFLYELYKCTRNICVSYHIFHVKQMMA
ncbi:hypothetical protein HanRHA438_Chr14g0631561 [Helianthus annuus]|nr:hypothetical protein HanRHA438_Chr14g0631561 [Helianthus annuus]